MPHSCREGGVPILDKATLPLHHRQSTPSLLREGQAFLERRPSLISVGGTVDIDQPTSGSLGSPLRYYLWRRC
jgi:hypothetical protein